MTPWPPSPSRSLGRPAPSLLTATKPDGQLSGSLTARNMYHVRLSFTLATILSPPTATASSFLPPRCAIRIFRRSGPIAVSLNSLCFVDSWGAPSSLSSFCLNDCNQENTDHKHSSDIAFIRHHNSALRHHFTSHRNAWLQRGPRFQARSFCMLGMAGSTLHRSTRHSVTTLSLSFFHITFTAESAGV